MFSRVNMNDTATKTVDSEYYTLWVKKGCHFYFLRQLVTK